VELSLTLSNNEGDIVTDELVLSFKTAPEAPQTAEGPEYVDVYVTTTSEYITTGLPEISEYAWYLEPAEAGTIEGTSIKSTVTWNPDYLGTAYVSVAAINDCGTGDVSVPFEVTVGNTVSTGDIEGRRIGVTVFPNPGSGLFNLQISSGQPDLLSIKLNNLLGETILSKSVQVDNTKDYQLNLDYLPDGVYFLVIGNDEEVVTKKLVKK
jgi:hypothetical protein